MRDEAKKAYDEAQAQQYRCELMRSRNAQIQKRLEALRGSRTG
jgi:hypothetical protein